MDRKSPNGRVSYWIVTVQNTQLRKIDQRIEPPVAGIDLEQALNYVDLDVSGEEFLHEHYTGTRLPYVRGSRPLLEKIAGDVSGGALNPGLAGFRPCLSTSLKRFPGPATTGS